MEYLEGNMLPVTAGVLGGAATYMGYYPGPPQLTATSSTNEKLMHAGMAFLGLYGLFTIVNDRGIPGLYTFG